MRRTLVRGDPVIGMSSGIAPISNGAVIVEDGLVAAIGTADALADQGRFDEVLGSPGHVVLPGLVNAHHHGGRTFRSGLPELPFERRSLYLHLLLAGGTEEGSYRNTLYSCMELLRNGVTSVAVVFYPNVALPEAGAEAVLQAYLDSGMRVAFAVAQRDRALYVHEDDDRFCATLPSVLAARLRASALGRYSQRSLSNPEYFGLIRGLFKRWHGRDDRIRIDAGPDWFPSCSDELLIESRRFADDFGTNIQIHLLETRYEMLMARRWYGESAIQHLVGLGVLGPDVVCAHSVWVTDDDIAHYADTGAIAVHNPASNLRLASGVAPVRAFLERGASVAFGCDGLSLADDNDLLSDLRLADQLPHPGDRGRAASGAHPAAHGHRRRRARDGDAGTDRRAPIRRLRRSRPPAQGPFQRTLRTSRDTDRRGDPRPGPGRGRRRRHDRRAHRGARRTVHRDRRARARTGARRGCARRICTLRRERRGAGARSRAGALRRSIPGGLGLAPARARLSVQYTLTGATGHASRR